MADKKPWEGEQAPEQQEPQEKAAPAAAPEINAKQETPKKDLKKVKTGNEKQAPLALANLVSQGMSLKDAKKKLGIK